MMGINPANDIIVDVMNAADPQRAAAATQRLVALGGGAPPGDGAFAAALDVARAPPPARQPPSPRIEMSPEGRAAKVETDFEALLLGDFVKEMLPSGPSDVFGGGMAGDMWRGMLADQIARQIARSGALGLGKRLFATHPPGGAAIGRLREDALRAAAQSAAAQAIGAADRRS